MIWIHIFSLIMKGETIMDKQLPAIYNDPYISEYFKILYKEHKENKINTRLYFKYGKENRLYDK